MSVARHPAGDRANPASAGSRGVAWPPRGRTPRTPRTPRAPLGARGRARGPAGWPPQPPRGRPVADRRSRGSAVAMAGRLAPPRRGPRRPPGGGWSAAGGGLDHRPRTAPPSPVGLSRYPTRTPSAVSGHLHTRTRRPAGRSGPLTGPARGLRADALPTLSRCGTYAGPWRTLRRTDDPFPLVMPLVGQWSAHADRMPAAGRPHPSRSTGVAPRRLADGHVSHR